MKRIIAYLAFAICLSGCIVNNLPLPVLVAEVISLDAENASSVTIDAERRAVTIELNEGADAGNVNVTSVGFKHSNTVSVPEMTGTHDLSSTKKFVLSTYQDYQWTISATQKIERYFTVKGQVGATVIDDKNHRVVITVASNLDLNNLTVTSMKLGPAGITTCSPAMEEIHDFSDKVDVEVSYRNSVEKWQIYTNVTDVTVEMVSVDAWTGCAWLAANGLDDAVCGFRWRAKDADEWLEAEGVEKDGGLFKVCIRNLEPQSEYECLAYCNDDVTEVFTFTTEEARQLPNGNFEVTSLSSDGKYREWYDPQSADPFCREPWWGSGNGSREHSGSAAYSIICAPDSDIRMEGSQSACLLSKYAIVKFAAGNLFTGDFAGLVGTQGGMINFGRPWTFRPQAIRLWARYESGIVDYVDAGKIGQRLKPGDADECSMMIMLGDWDPKRYKGTQESPVMVNTTDFSTFIDTSAEAVIACGTFYSDKSSKEWDDSIQGATIISTAPDGWVELEIKLDYRTTERKPTHIILSFASSRYGDYFSGSSDSRLWLDDIRLIY